MMKYIKGFLDYRFLLSELVKKGIRLKYRRSYLGILWSLIEPILTTIVLVIVFGTIFNKGKDANFPLYIIIGRLLYSFFQNATKGSLTAIRKNAGMIKKVYVPQYLYPLSNVLFNFIIFGISLIVVIGVDIYCQVIPDWRLILWIPALFVLLVLAIGIGLILATLNVFFRDIEYLWNVALMLIMYMSAIFYDPDKLLSSGFSYVLKLNPLYQIITFCRVTLMGGPISINGVIYTLCVSFGSLILGLVVFKKSQDKFILHI